MTLSNPRWLIDGAPATSFVYGRKAEMAVDVTDTPGTVLVFKLTTTTSSSPLEPPRGLAVPTTGATPRTVTVPVTLAHQWKVLSTYPTDYSYFNKCADAGTTLPYETNSSFLTEQITDDLLFPPLTFSVTELGHGTVTSPVIRREMPQFIPGNAVDLLVNGDQMQPAVIAAIDAAEHHIHLNWFFFATRSPVATALFAAAVRGVEVRLLFDQVATATPEPVGQGIPPQEFIEGMAVLAMAGVKIGPSSLAVAPLDNLYKVTDPEYRDRLDVQKEYTKQLLIRHGGVVAKDTLINGTKAKIVNSIPIFIRDEYESLQDWGSAGIGTPAFLGGCRDHTKLIIVDGTTAFCGGANAQRYYLYNNPIDPYRDIADEMVDPANPEKWPKWHDCFVRYRGPAVRDAQKYFIERWAVCTGEYLSRTSPDYFPSTGPLGPASIKVINNVPGLERDIGAEYLRMFRNSTQMIQVLNPYVTDDLLATYMAHAAQVRRVPLELIVPEKYLDFNIARDLMKTRWDALRAAGVDLYAYDSHMMHVKVATADGHKSIVGSYNFAKTSAATLFEHGIVVNDPAFAAEVGRELFDVDRPASRRVTTDVAPDWPVLKHSVGRFMDRIV